MTNCDINVRCDVEMIEESNFWYSFKEYG